MSKLLIFSIIFFLISGSSVATSLCGGERELKHIALLQICKKKYNLKKIRLQTVRPFIFEDIYLQEHELPTNIPRKKAVLDFVSNYIEHTVMPEAAKQLTGIFSYFFYLM